ncbi:MAG: glycosyltransferase family 2 protein [Candidatus Cloacimonetes bacterium]|nr:glycosyltransferase family 2 protein [Candidatus Cloacimonadota bacterium]
MFRHKYTKAQNLRYLLSFPLSLLQLFRHTSKRKNGISVIIRVKDEEDWIAKSLLSLNEFADEVVVVNNNSLDDTLKEIESVKSQLKYKLIVEDEPSDGICEVSNHALSLTNFRWIFRWDSDFIAYTSGERNIKLLREYLLNLNHKKHYLIFPLTLSFAGDLFHVKTGKETNSEGYIHTWHSKLKYIKKGKFESLQVPLFYKIKRLKEIYFVHIGSAKPMKKLLYRFFWLFWLKERDKFATINEFINHISKEKWNGLSPENIAIAKFRELILPIRKFNVNEFGNYPEIMNNDVKTPKLEIIYKNEKPFSRNDFMENIS